MSTGPEYDRTVGVANPYAAAELALGRRVDWDEVDTKAVFERVFDHPYEDLFDPEKGSPLYIGVSPEVSQVSVEDFSWANDETPTDLDLSTLSNVADVSELTAVSNVSDVEIENPELTPEGRLNLDVGLENGVGLNTDRLAEILEALESDEEEEWDPESVRWRDLGDFFREATEFDDPVQGNVGDCYLIAALGAVAWTFPAEISRGTRSTGPDEGTFKNVLKFYSSDDASTSEDARRVDVDNKLPVDGFPGVTPMFARSSDLGETWPAIYEKAYAKWKLGTGSEKPDITAIAGGDPLEAVVELTGFEDRKYYYTNSTTADDLWLALFNNTSRHKAIWPMVASTYSTSEKAGEKVTYDDANVVANHAYTVLGSEVKDGARYVILRNPWGRMEVTDGALDGTWRVYDRDTMREIGLPEADGVFGLPIEEFKKYFERLGVAWG